MFLIKLIILVLLVGYFYNVGKSRSKLSGYFWGILSFLLWVASGLFNIYFGIDGQITTFITTITFQTILGIIENRISKRELSNKFSLSITKIQYEPNKKSIDIFFTVDNYGTPLSIKLLNSNYGIEYEGEFTDFQRNINIHSIHCEDLSSGSYTLSIFSGNSLADSKNFYFDLSNELVSITK